MQLVTLSDQDKSFFAVLKQHPELDGRDPRGRRHSLPVVLLGVLMAICSGADGNLSCIQRHMKKRFDVLCRLLDHKAARVISRAQLPRFLAQINQPVLTQLVLTHYGITLPDTFSEWLSGDGKELRGSIQKGQQRGQACVSVITQSSKSMVAQGYYNGRKESERLAIHKLLIDNGLLDKKITLDALHLTPGLLENIHFHKGTYLIGLKGNQHHLLRLCIVNTLVVAPFIQRVDTPERGHGRIEQRTYACFPMDKLKTDSRWNNAGLSTLVRVERIRWSLAGVELSRTESYFVTNQRVDTAEQANELFDAIRGHWSVESMHYQRDVVLAEDKCRSKVSGLQRIMSSIRTLVISILQSDKPKNMVAQIEDFANDTQLLFQFLKLKKVL